MAPSDSEIRCSTRFAEAFGGAPSVIASAPGRLEVLGNHTDYNLGLTLSCAVDLRCYASITPLDKPAVCLASTAFAHKPVVFELDRLAAPKGHWAGYVIGLVTALAEHGYAVPGFEMLIDSDVPASAGLSSSAALEMSALTALARLMRLDLSPIELAKIGQRVESDLIGAQTGLLDQLTSLLGKSGHLLGIDFKTLETQHFKMPAGWCFVAVDSVVKHDLTREYNQRRASCERAAVAMGVASLRDADSGRLARHRPAMTDDAWRCARHVIAENDRVRQAHSGLQQGDVETLGRLMFRSHASSRDDFRNSCEQLDALVAHAEQDTRCIGARLSGGGFGGITIHLVREEEAQAYLDDLLRVFKAGTEPRRWARVCRIADGACV